MTRWGEISGRKDKKQKKRGTQAIKGLKPFWEKPSSRQQKVS